MGQRTEQAERQSHAWQWIAAARGRLLGPRAVWLGAAAVFAAAGAQCSSEESTAGGAATGSVGGHVPDAAVDSPLGGGGNATAGAGGLGTGGGATGGGGGVAPYCGDLACNDGEDCNSCPGDCGPCPLGFPPGSPDADPNCTGPGGEAGMKCGGISDAYVANAVNIGYYPFRIKAGYATHLYTCDNRAIEDLSPGQGFAAQSTRNPSCSDNPPLRPSLNGFVFGYARGTMTSGWVPADALEFAGYDGGPCTDGPSNEDFEVAHNPYDGCAALVCDGTQSCAAANDPNAGTSDCGGHTTNVTRTVSATDLYLRYAPGSTALRYLHQGDQVQVLYDNQQGWFFIQVTATTCPALSPDGSRGWLLATGVQ
jgi:hypothetical protein